MTKPIFPLYNRWLSIIRTRTPYVTARPWWMYVIMLWYVSNSHSCHVTFNFEGFPNVNLLQLLTQLLASPLEVYAIFVPKLLISVYIGQLAQIRINCHPLTKICHSLLTGVEPGPFSCFSRNFGSLKESELARDNSNQHSNSNKYMHCNPYNQM